MPCAHCNARRIPPLLLLIPAFFAGCEPSKESGATAPSNQKGASFVPYRGDVNHTGVFNTRPPEPPITVKWKRPWKWEWVDPKRELTDTPTSAIIVGDTLYIGLDTKFVDARYNSETHAMGGILAVDKRTGKEKWRYEAGHQVAKTPKGRPIKAGGAGLRELAFEGGVVVSSYFVPKQDGHVMRVEDGTEVAMPGYPPEEVFFAIDENGSLMWELVRKSSGERLDRYSAQFLDGKVFLPGSDGTLYALDTRSGDVRWTFSTAGLSLQQLLLFGNSLVFSTRNYDGKNLYCVDAATGQGIWAHEYLQSIVGGIGGCALRDGVIYSIHGDQAPTRAIDATNGNLIWKDSPGQFGNTRPVVDSIHMYVGNTGRLAGLDRKTGAVQWNSIVGNEWIAPSGVKLYRQIEELAAVGDVLYGLDAAWTIYAVSAASGSTQWKATIAGGDDQSLSPSELLVGPIIDDGVLFAGWKDSLYAVE